MKSADIFIEICTKDRLNLCSLEYSLLKKDAMMMIDSNTSLNSFLNESVSVENPLNVSRFTNKLVKLMNKVKKSSKIG
jgi:trehalose-6-phosphate synthase